MAGFEWAYNLSGGAARIVKYVVKDTVVLSAGEVVTLDTGEVDAGATGDAGAFVGVCVEDSDNTSDGETVSVIVNPDAVYRVTDLNARNANAALDLASGGMGVTTDSNSDLLVVRTSTATEKTEVTWNMTHFTQVAS